MQLINLLLSTTLFLIMISVGSSIELSQLKRIFQKPKRLIIGLIIQIILFPIFAFLIASISNLPPEYKVGLIILAACPGGTLSSFITYLVKGNTALSVGLVSTNSLIVLFTIPFYLGLAFLTFLNQSISVTLPVLEIIFQVILLAILPVIIGSVLRYYFSNKIEKSQKYLKIVSSVLLATFFIIKFLGSESIGGIGINKEMVFSILPWAVILNVVGFFIGYLTMKLMNSDNKTSTTIGIEVGLQNTVLALLITDVILLQPTLGHPALIYALFSFWITLAFGFIFVRNNDKKST